MGNSTLPLGGGDTTKLSEVILQPGHTFAPGDVVRPSIANPEEYVLAQADNAENAEAVGIVETVAGPSFQITFQGKIDLSAVTWGDLPFATLGEVWFLSDTVAGELTRTPPSTAGTVIKAMLVVNNVTNSAEEGILTGYIGVQIGGENLVDLNDIQPVGSIMPWAAAASSPLPNGWRFCNGDSLDTTDFAELFAVIAYDYGGAASNFNVPDLQGRFPIGQDVGGDVDFDQVGETGGEKDHILSADELPSHTHEVDPGQTDFVARQQGTPGQTLDTTAGADETDFPTNTGDVDFPGSGNLPHNNMPPFLTINFIIRTTAQSSAALLDHGLSDHNDVGDVSNPNDCDILKFQNGQWEAAPGAAPPGGAVFSFRNQIINGRFDVWQRGTSFNNFTLYNADRWHTAGEEQGGTFTANVNQQTFALGQTDVPGNPNRYVTIQSFITGGGPNASSIFIQRIEGVRTFNGSQATVSFWAKGDTAGTVAVQLRQAFGTGGSPSGPVEIPGQEIVLLNGVWQYYTLTFSIPSIAGKTLGTNNNDSLRLRIFTFSNAGSSALIGLPNPVNFTGTMSLANVQIEEGATATAFEIRELETEVALCQRYFCKSHDIDTAPFNMSAVPGVLDNTQDGTPGIFEIHGTPLSGGQGCTSLWPVRMRAAPSVLVVQVAPSQGPSGLETLAVNFIGEGSASWISNNTICSFLYTADAEL